MINIAGYELFALRGGGDIVLRMPVIVGKAFTSTPVFSDRIRYIEINPFWNLPTSIMANEILPKLQKNPGYLASQHMRLFAGWGEGASELDPQTVDWSAVDAQSIARYRIRQDPGTSNSLGTIKFMFPNQYDVYLHDTPARALFSRTERAFSHGCIRVSDPHALAEFLLGGESAGWSARDVAAAIRGGDNQTIRLGSPVPVHITYRTAWVEADGSIQFRPDIYGRDQRVGPSILADATLR